MPLAAVIATQLHGPAGAIYGLWIDNLNVRPFVPIDSVTITEAGPGGVSSMSFVIEDPTGVIPIPTAGAVIRLQEFTFDTPAFLGYVSDYNVQVMGIGRTITVEAVGVEIVLDWTAVPITYLARTPITPPYPAVDGVNGATDLNPGRLSENIWYLANVIGPISDIRLNLFAPLNNGTTPVDGDASLPVGTLFKSGLFPEIASLGHPVGPGSLRQALEDAIKASFYGSFGSTNVPDAVLTVDFYRRLRVFFRDAAPDDYTNLTVSTAGPIRAENIQYEVHPGDVVRTVYVNGGNAAGSGYVTDGSGIFGRQAVIDSPTSTTAGRRDQIGAQYLASQATLVRGTFMLTDWTPTAATIHPASTVTITDLQVGLTAQTYPIAEITKGFTGTRQNWTISFGGVRPSYVEAVRREYGTDEAFGTMQLGGVRGN